MPRAHTVTEISRNYWSVETPDGARLGDILGGGPTADTRFKAISPRDGAIDPDSAPGTYFRSLAGAARFLAG